MDNENLLIPLLQNASILLAMVVVYATASSHLGKRQGSSLARKPVAQILNGLLLGAMGIAIVMTPVEYVQNVILDTRSILISLAALFFGPVTGLITMAVIAMYRISLGGATLITGLAVIAGSGAVGLGWRYFRKPDLRRLSWLELYLFGIAVHLLQVVFTFSLPDELELIVLRDTAVPIMLIFPLATLLLGKLLVRFSQEEVFALELQEKEQRLRMALSASGQELFELNLQTGAMTTITEEENARRYPEQRFHTNLMTLLQDLHPDDETKISEAFEQLRSGAIAEWRGEFRQATTNGSWCWFAVAGRLVAHDDKGRPLLMLGTWIDIDERKRAEMELQLASLVYQNSREAMMVTDADSCIIDVNPTFTRITGYTRDEIVGSKPSILQSGRHDAGFYRDMWNALEEHGHWSGEIWNRRKNGEVFPEWIEINAVPDDKGNVRRWVAQFNDISEKKSAEEQIWRQANFDVLTNLPNRSMFHDRLGQEIKQARRKGKRLALLFLDLDRFKEVNDTLGHDMGDLLLKHVAQRLKESVRDSDTISRLGGDEFIIILNELQESAVVGAIAQKILDRLATPFMLKANSVFVSASLGITLYPDDGDTLDVLMKNADQAMYAAKREGRNRYNYFTASMQAQVNRRAQLTKDLRTALEQEQFHVLFQPVVSLPDGAIRKAETLLRWNHPIEGSVPPDVFIPVAEDAGLIVPLGNLVFRHATRLAGRLRSLVPDFQISVNKSPAQFDSKQDNWFAVLKDSGLPGQSLVVEITEGLLLNTRESVLRQLDELQEAGVQVALDDFGTGYSSLAYLKKFHISYLKIDQSFVRNIAPGNQDQALVEAMITMAHRLSLEVIAEGVETEAQCTLLKQAGCDYGQGYLFSHPITAEALELLVRKQLQGGLSPG